MSHLVKLNSSKLQLEAKVVVWNEERKEKAAALRLRQISKGGKLFGEAFIVKKL